MPIPSTSVAALHAHLTALGVRPGMTLAVHAHLIIFGRIEGGAATLFELLLDMIGEQGTLILPSYTLNLTGEDIFDPLSTPSHGMGALSEYGRKSGGMLRSSSPTHSHLFVGAGAAMLSRGAASCSLGAGSDFQLMQNAGASLLLLGCTFRQGATFVHHVEAMEGVPYREWIVLSRRVRGPDGMVGDISIQYYGRIEGTPWQTDLRSVEDEVTRRSVGRSHGINGGRSYLMELVDLHAVVAGMIDKNPYALMTRKSDRVAAS